MRAALREQAVPAGPLGGRDYFEGVKPDAALMRKTVRSGVITVISQFVAVGIQFASIVILSRLLTPRDFGLVAMVVFFSQPLQNLGENGFLDSIVQSESLEHRELSNLFWINVGASLLLMGLFGFVAPVLAALYHEPELALLGLALAPGIFFASLGSQHLGLLRRTMQFGRINSWTLTNRVVAAAASIAAAVAGWGYWAVVLGLILPPALNTAVYWFLCSWRPGWPDRGISVRAHVHYTVHNLGRFYLNYFGRNADNLIVGAALGSTALGIYKKAYDLFALSSNLLSTPLASVALSGLSRIRNEPERIRRNYLKAVNLFAFFGAPVSGALVLCGEPVMVLLLGEQWRESGRIFSYFAPGIVLLLVYSTTSWLHLALGTMRLWLKWTLLETGFSIACFLAGLQFGTVGVAVAWVTSLFLLLGPGMVWAGRKVGLTFPMILAAVVPHLLAAIVATVGVAILFEQVDGARLLLASLPALLKILVLSAAVGSGFVLAVASLPTRATFSQVLELFQNLRGARS